MIRSFCLVPLLLIGLMASSNGAVVTFKGELNNLFFGTDAIDIAGSGGTVGFALVMDVTDSAGPTSNITSGSLRFYQAGQPTFALAPASVNVAVTDNGSTDQITFNSIGGSDPSVSFSLNGDYVASTAINASTFTPALFETESVTIGLTGPGGTGVYTGNIALVPEPATGLACLGLMAGLAMVRRRRA